MKLTANQELTLRRLKSGTRYFIRGDGLKGNVRRVSSMYRYRDVSAPAIPVLFRLGMIEIMKHGEICPTQYYGVKIKK